MHRQDVTLDLVRRAESIEAMWMSRIVAETPEPAQTALGVAATKIGGGTVLSVRSDPTRYFSKALGFGFGTPVTDDLVSEVIAFYRSNGDRSATLQVAPQVLPQHWPEICERLGLRRVGSWYKLGALVVETVPPVTNTALRIAPVLPSERLRWAEVVVDGFSMPVELSPMTAAGAAAPDVRAYGAYDCEAIVAGGLLGVHGNTAGLGAAATLPGYRGRGAQTGLIAARITAARDLGCTWVMVETDADPSGASTSLANLRRAGLRVLYERANWVWTA